MASKTVVTLIDDLDAKVIDGDGGTVAFTFEGVNYKIDLAEKNLTKFRKALNPYITAATKVRNEVSTSPRTRRTEVLKDPQQIREWARSNGYEVAARGRVPADVVTAYEAAH